MRKASDDAPTTSRSSFTFSDVEDVIERLIASPLSTTDGRPFEYVGGTVRSKVGKACDTWVHTNSKDFSNSEGSQDPTCIARYKS